MTPVEQDELVASLRIVPLLTQQEQVNKAVEIAKCLPRPPNAFLPTYSDGFSYYGQ